MEWEKQQIEALYTTAEDIKRFAPWESDIAPFVLMDASQPDKKVLVVFEEDHEEGLDIRFILSAQGIRAWLQEEVDDTEDFDEEDLPPIEEMVNSYEGDYLEVGYHTSNPNNFEKHHQGSHPELITFRRQRPGCRLSTINRRWDYSALLTYLKQTLKVLRLQLAEDATNEDFHLNAYSDQTTLQTACFVVNDEGATRQAPFHYGKAEMLRLAEASLDEFSNARVKHLPKSQKMYELFYFYLPANNESNETLPLAVFLVDLDSGLIEWNDVYFNTEKLPETLLRHLWQHFITLGSRPDTIFMQSLRSYCSLAKDMARAGISPQYIEFSYVGQELFDSYVETMHLKAHQLFADRFPKEPY